MAGSGVISGTVSAGSGCTTSSTSSTSTTSSSSSTGVQVTLSSGGQTLYNTSVSIGGTYQFQANPGSYTLYAVASNCSAQTAVTVMANQTQQYNLTLSPSTATATNSSLASPYTPYCAYGIYGCMSAYYPGYLPIAYGKPNLYVWGPAGTQFNINLKFPGAAHILAASPVYTTDGWNGVIQSPLNNISQIQVNNVTYNYLFYDLRGESDPLQNQDSFCESKNNLLPSLVQYLKNAGFRDNEIQDFQSSWNTALPSADKYCVYPQTNTTIDAIATIEMSPQPDVITRVWFVIAPTQNNAQALKTINSMKAKSKYFAKMMQTNWKRFFNPHHPSAQKYFAQMKMKKTANRRIASDSSASSTPPIEVHEWAVGLFFE